jgi:hypothetical protein
MSYCTSEKMVKLLGDPNTEQGEYMIMMPIDVELQKAYPFLPKKIYMNALLAFPLKRVLFRVNQEGLAGEIKSISCFNVRPVRGYEKSVPRIWSNHSWGGAVDVNEKENPLGGTCKIHPRVIEIFIEEGFVWGGVWKRKDSMHFELPWEAYIKK